jgi:hypothetical protein
MTAADVRSEIASLLNGRTGESQPPVSNGVQRVGKPAEAAPVAAKATKPPVKASAAASKAKGKKR